MIRPGFVRGVLFGTMACVLHVAVAAAQDSLPTIDPFNNRHALVIGNGAYSRSPLKNPDNDAVDMAAALKSAGFKVTHGRNLDQAQMRLVIQQFVETVPEGAAVLFFFAGHGVQFAGQNYLLPVDATSRIAAPRDLDGAAVSMSDLLSDFQRTKAAITVLLLDACRDSPFSDIRDIEPGLARAVARQTPPDAAPQAPRKAQPSLEGVLISYSTAPNSVAADGSGRNSPYTQHLKRSIVAPNVSLETALKTTRSAVTKATGGRQTPWYESSLTGEFFAAGTDRISIEALIGMFLPARDENYIASASYLLPWDPVAQSPIKWRHAGLREGAKLTSFVLSDQSAPYSRAGDVIVTIDGRPTHTALDKTRRPIKWTVTLLGPRGGANVVALSNDVLSQQFSGFKDRTFLTEDKACQSGGPIDGTTVYAVSLPNKVPAWLAEGWSCGGSGGCTYEYHLFASAAQKKSYACK